MRPMAFLAALAVLIGAGIVWTVTARPDGFILATSDSRGLQVGDPVIRSGVRVGQVMGVSESEVGTEVEFQLDQGQELFTGDFVTIEKPLLSTQTEVQITRDCLPQAQGSEPTAMPFGETLQEASMAEILANRARCSGPIQWIEERLRSMDTDQAVADFQELVEELKAQGADAWERGEALVRENGDDLIQRFEESGLREKADSVRAIISEAFRS